MPKKNEYTNESIKALTGADRVRKRPAVIFGSDDLEGCKHSAFEILSNSIDEAREGHGDRIIVTKYKDHSIEVEDFGRGCPVDFNKSEGKYNWELVYCELYAGGKYNTNSGENYEYSLGLNGLGACATQYSSEYMDVTVYRDKKKYSLRFEKGENVGGLAEEEFNKRRTGTVTRWRPDLEVFTDIAIEREYFEDILKKQAIVNAGITFEFRFESESGMEKQEFCYPNGIADYIAELAGDKTITQPVMWTDERRGRDREDKPEYKVKLSCCFAFSNTVNLIEYYHNSSFLEHGGAPDKALRIAFVAELDAYLKAEGKYNKNESKITFQDVADCLLFVSNCFSTQTSYANQTKKSITNKFIQECTTDFLRENLKIFLIENKMDAQKIANQVLINKRAREKSERERINIKKTLSGTLDITNRIQKFVDCETKDITKRELYIVEGDSALGSCKQGRDSYFQAIMPVRGKILNCLKAEYDKIFKSDIIVDLLKIFGCGVEIKAKTKDLQNFDINNLRWNKIIICTDADVDGFQIRTLILTMIYRLTPTLIEQGYVYIAESPLFEITVQGNDTPLFAYTDKDKDDIVSKYEQKGKKVTVMRSKGLGENEPDMMWLTTMSPETRRLIQVTPDDAETTSQMFDILLGDNLQGRKDFIAENGYKYLDDVDLS
ncbi:MAG: DNA topoisomerase [Clostridia bacterium]|nr:DNA topoisomerase [Clostridia bacterium]